jgi:hypothetical protein
MTGKTNPDKSKIRIGRLDTIGGTIKEMGCVYREMRRGELDTLEGKRLVDALTAIRQGLEITDIEKRLIELEGKR